MGLGCGGFGTRIAWPYVHSLRASFGVCVGVDFGVKRAPLSATGQRPISGRIQPLKCLFCHTTAAQQQNAAASSFILFTCFHSSSAETYPSHLFLQLNIVPPCPISTLSTASSRPTCECASNPSRGCRTADVIWTYMHRNVSRTSLYRLLCALPCSPAPTTHIADVVIYHWFCYGLSFHFPVTSTVVHGSWAHRRRFRTARSGGCASGALRSRV